MRRRLFAYVGISALSALGIVVGCSTAPARRPNVIPPRQLRADPRLAEGQRVFMQHCNQCHVGGAAGLGPSLNDKWLPPIFIRFQVRHGLGAMPSYSDRVISDAQLDDVVHYVRYLHLHPRDLRG